MPVVAPGEGPKVIADGVEIAHAQEYRTHGVERRLMGTAVGGQSVGLIDVGHEVVVREPLVAAAEKIPVGMVLSAHDRSPPEPLRAEGYNQRPSRPGPGPEGVPPRPGRSARRQDGRPTREPAPPDDLSSRPMGPRVDQPQDCYDDGTEPVELVV